MGAHSIDRARCELGRGRPQPVLLSDAEQARALFEPYSRRHPQSAAPPSAPSSRSSRRGSRRPRAPIYGKLDGDLAAALMGINAVKGVEIGAGFAAARSAARKMPTRCAWANDGKPRVFCPTMPAAFWAAFRPGQSIVALRGQADLVDPLPRDAPSTVRGRDRDQHQGAPRPLRRHPRGADRRGHGSVRDRRSLSASSRPDGRAAGVAVRPAPDSEVEEKCRQEHDPEKLQTFRIRSCDFEQILRSEIAIRCEAIARQPGKWTPGKCSITIKRVEEVLAGFAQGEIVASP